MSVLYELPPNCMLTLNNTYIYSCEKKMTCNNLVILFFFFYVGMRFNTGYFDKRVILNKSRVDTGLSCSRFTLEETWRVLITTIYCFR